MASKITKNNYACRKMLNIILEALEAEIEEGATPMDAVHALTFCICLFKIRFEWSTEDILQIYEEYVVKMEKAMDDPEPYGEA